MCGAERGGSARFGQEAGGDASDGGRQRGFLGADADSSWSWERQRAWAIRVVVEAAWGVGRSSQWASGPGAAPGLVRAAHALTGTLQPSREDTGSNGGAQLVVCGSFFFCVLGGVVVVVVGGVGAVAAMQ